MMEQLIVEFEKALAAHQEQICKKDTLVGLGEILIKELRKQNSAVITLGQLLADLYAQAREVHARAYTLSIAEAFNLAQLRKGLTLS
jgi:hypothetical protein